MWWRGACARVKWVSLSQGLHNDYDGEQVGWEGAVLLLLGLLAGASRQGRRYTSYKGGGGCGRRASPTRGTRRVRELLQGEGAGVQPLRCAAWGGGHQRRLAVALTEPAGKERP